MGDYLGADCSKADMVKMGVQISPSPTNILNKPKGGKIMNQEQRNYALGRISFMETEKIEEVTNKFTTPEVELGFKEKVELARKGKVPVTTNKIDAYDHFGDIFDFTKYEKKAAFNSAKANPIIASIRKLATKTRDKIMLAKDTEALAAIDEFEKTIKAI
ncbi:MAG: hypothetical protein WC373_13870 [Smithella sp.]|jgi:hypothetical protein